MCSLDCVTADVRAPRKESCFSKARCWNVDAIITDCICQSGCRVLSFLFRSGLLSCLLLVSACSLHGAAEGLSSLPEADPITEATGLGEYRLGPSDLLAVTVFQVPDLNREVRVNNSGQISLPLIGGVDVAGLTVGDVEQEIATRYQGRYLQNPQVSVFVKEFSSQRVTVSGAVKKPGIYPMSSRLTLLQSIAMAEGFNDVGSMRNVLVFRTVDGNRQYARFDVAAIDRGEDPDPEIYGDDLIVVDTSAGKVTLKTLVQMSPFVAVWRAYR